MSKANDLTGKKFGKLTVLERCENSKSGYVRWLCKCDCGNNSIVYAGNLTKKHTTSCGCYKKQKTIEVKTKHGKVHTRIYKILNAMKDRCFNENNDRYNDYGGRGITICSEWLGENGFNNFEQWALNNGYSEKLTIDRIDPNGNYEPSNCRWATVKEQNNNQRKNIYIEYAGETKTLAQWAEELNFPYFTLYARIVTYGWNIKEAFERPIGNDIWHKTK